MLLSPLCLLFSKGTHIPSRSLALYVLNGALHLSGRRWIKSGQYDMKAGVDSSSICQYCRPRDLLNLLSWLAPAYQWFPSLFTSLLWAPTAPCLLGQVGLFVLYPHHLLPITSCVGSCPIVPDPPGICL